MNRRAVLGWASAAVVVVAIGGVALWPRVAAQEMPSPDKKKSDSPRLLIKTVTARALETAETIRLTGQIEAYRVSAVATEIGDRLETRPVERGDRIAIGQTIATLNDDLALAVLHEAEAGVLRVVAARRQVEADYARASVETRAAISQAKAQIETAQAAETKTRSFTRSQELAQAEAGLNAAKADETLARKDYERYETLVREDTLPRQALDRAKASLDASIARRESAEQTVSLAREGARQEDIAQATAQVSVARAGLESANARPERLEVIRRQIEALRAQEREAQAGVEQARIAVRKHRVAAPFAGRVLETLAEPGEMLSAGSSIVRLADLRTVKAVFALPESLRPGLRPGMLVSLVADALPGRTIKGRIKVTGYEADQKARTFPVEIAIGNTDEKLLPGMVVRLALQEGGGARRRGVTVPVSAIASDGTDSYVFRIEDGRAVRQTVALGKPTGADTVEILQGLQAGVPIAATPQRLTDGVSVTTEPMSEETSR